jgi:hemolysin activation/secretion protein
MQLQRHIPTEFPQSKEEVKKTAPTEDSMRVLVNKFIFKGYEGLATEEELHKLVRDHESKELSYGELKDLCVAISGYLRKKGWLVARAYLPPQDVAAGIIEIAIIQGKSDGRFDLKTNESARINRSVLEKIAQNGITEGEPLKEQKLERSLMLMNDLPGMTVKSSIAPGAQPGTATVAFDANEGPLMSGMLQGDSQGNRYTGVWRGVGLLNLNDPFRYGDQLSLNLIDSEGLQQGYVGYTFPLAANGLQGNISYTGMHYDVVSGSTSSLDINGDAQTADLGLSYPLVRNRLTKLILSAGYEYKHLTDESQNSDIDNKDLHSGTGNINGSIYDNMLWGGATLFNAGFTTGHLHNSTGGQGQDTLGGYTRYNGGLTHIRNLGSEAVTLCLGWSGQFSLDNLDSSEKFYLGGPNGVRAYPLGEAGGDQGMLLNADLDYKLPVPDSFGSIKLNAFYDAGKIWLHRFPWNDSISTATGDNQYWIEGAGMGATYAYDRFTLKGIWAHALGSNPGRSANGLNADEKDSTNRFWIISAMVF